MCVTVVFLIHFFLESLLSSQDVTFFKQPIMWHCSFSKKEKGCDIVLLKKKKKKKGCDIVHIKLKKKCDIVISEYITLKDTHKKKL